MEVCQLLDTRQNFPNLSSQVVASDQATLQMAAGVAGALAGAGGVMKSGMAKEDVEISIV